MIEIKLISQIQLKLIGWYGPILISCSAP